MKRLAPMTVLQLTFIGAIAVLCMHIPRPHHTLDAAFAHMHDLEDSEIIDDTRTQLRIVVTVTDPDCKKVIVYADATNEEGRTSTVHSRQFKVCDLPIPELTIDGEHLAAIPFAQLHTHHALSAAQTDEDWPRQYNIKSYELTLINSQNKCLGIFNITGNTLGAGTAAEKAWTNLEPNSRIYIANTIATAPNGNITHPKGLALTVR